MCQLGEPTEQTGGLLVGSSDLEVMKYYTGEQSSPGSGAAEQEQEQEQQELKRNLEELDIAVLNNHKGKKALRDMQQIQQPQSKQGEVCLDVALSALKLKQDPTADNIDTNFVEMIHDTKHTVKDLRQ